MYPHRIRLRGPWEVEANGHTGRLMLPCAPAALPPHLLGRVRLRRRFGYPGRIDAEERVWLVMEGIRRPVDVALNGSLLGVWQGTGEHDATGQLETRNELTVDVPDLAPDNGLWDEAALEVRRRAYLRNVRVIRRGGDLLVSGEVVGQAEGPLELYLVADRSPADYQWLQPGGGTFFPSHSRRRVKENRGNRSRR